jgi:hypothetical protein
MFKSKLIDLDLSEFTFERPDGTPQTVHLDPRNPLHRQLAGEIERRYVLAHAPQLRRMLDSPAFSLSANNPLPKL